MEFWKSLESVSNWSMIAQIIGAICGLAIVILGLRVSQLQTMAQNNSDLLVAQASAAASEANKVAALANEGQAKANEKLAVTQLELERIRIKQIPRTIDPTLRVKYIRTLYDSMHGVKILISTVNGSDSETINYAKSLFDVFTHGLAGMPVIMQEIDFDQSELNSHSDYDKINAPIIPIGVILVTNPESKPNYTSVIEQIIGKSKHEFKTEIPPQTYQIIIGSKSD